jgi:hypothetical protein
MRLFELMIGVLVLTVLGSFVALLVKVSPVWKDAFRGFVPGSGIVKDGGLYIAVGYVLSTVYIFINDLKIDNLCIRLCIESSGQLLCLTRSSLVQKWPPCGDLTHLNTNRLRTLRMRMMILNPRLTRALAEHLPTVEIRYVEPAGLLLPATMVLLSIYLSLCL